MDVLNVQLDSHLSHFSMLTNGQLIIKKLLCLNVYIRKSIFQTHDVSLCCYWTMYILRYKKEVYVRMNVQPQQRTNVMYVQTKV